MDNPQLTKDIFCANEQQVTPHKGEVDGNGEFVFTCDCGRFIKFPADTTPEQFQELLVKHEEHNAGQISVAEQDKKLAALLGVPSIEDAEIVEEPAGTPAEEQAEPAQEEVQPEVAQPEQPAEQ